MGRDDYGPWTDEISEANTFFDLEIYDNHRLIYSAHQIADSHHRGDSATRQVSGPALDSSGRPIMLVTRSNTVSGCATTPALTWMRGYVGTNASEMPAFVRGFAALENKVPIENVVAMRPVIDKSCPIFALMSFWSRRRLQALRLTKRRRPGKANAASTRAPFVVPTS